MNLKKITKRQLFVDYIPTAIVALIMIFFAVMNGQSLFRTIPTLNSLVILILTVRANRFGFLYGAANCILYSIVFLSEGLYFSLLSTLLVSMPVQVFSFFHWNRHRTDKTQTKLRMMKWWQILLAAVAIIPAWAGSYFGLSQFITGSYPVLDSLSFVLGIMVSFLVAFRFVEGQYLNTLNSLLISIVWILICIKEPGNLNYVVLYLFTMIRVAEAAFNWTRLYLKDKKAEPAMA